MSVYAKTEGSDERLREEQRAVMSVYAKNRGQ
ncbi:Uncharacterised protein [Mycobacteroides abscessus subsp. abscessus]|nr:Uncharacterised protein [Mycobacteroides abscessus subsp. abscessus]